MAVRYDKNFNSEIRKAVNNYNNKIRRLESKENNYQLPPKITMKQIKSMYSTRKQIRSKLNELRRFSQRGAEETIVTSGGYAISLYEYKETKRQLANVKRQLTREIKSLEKIKPTILGERQGYTFADIGEDILVNRLAKRQSLNVNVSSLNRASFKRLQSRLAKIQAPPKSSGIFKENFIDMLESIDNFYGVDTTLIINRIRDLDDDLFYKIYQRERGIQVLMDYYFPTHISTSFDKRVYASQQSEIKGIVSSINDNIVNILKDYE